MKRLLAFAWIALAAAAALAADKPLVMESGQVKQLPAATALQLSAPTTANATANLPHGTAPTSPSDGDCWTTTTGFFCRINGVTARLSGTNTGDQTIALTGDVSGSGTGSFATTLATVNGNVGTFGSATQSLTVTVNAKGLVTSVSAQTVTPAFSSLTGTAAVTQGGTGLTATAQGDILYADAANSLARLAKSTTAARYLSNSGTSNGPAWAQVDLSNGVTGRLPYANLAQGPARSVLGVTGNAAADVAGIQGTANQVLTVNSGGTALAFGQVNLASSAAVTGALPVANGGTGNDGTIQTYTPTLSCGAGTLTSAAATGRYLQQGKLVWLWVRITITTNGTCASYVQFNAPVAARNNGGGSDYYPLSGRESAVVGFALNGAVAPGGTTTYVQKVDATYPGASGYVLVVSGWYEAA